MEQLPEVPRQMGAEQLRLATALPRLLDVLEVAGEVWEYRDFTDLADGVEDASLVQAHRDLHEAGPIQVAMNGVILQARIEAVSGAGHETDETWETMQRLLKEMRALLQEEVKASEERAAQRQLLRQQAIEVAEAARVAAQVASGPEEQPDEEEELAPLILLRSFLQTGYSVQAFPRGGSVSSCWPVAIFEASGFVGNRKASNDLLRRLGAFIDVVAAGKLSKDACWILGSRLVFLRKKSGQAPRPIRVGELWCRVIGKRLISANREAITKLCLGARQFGVGVPGGADALIHCRVGLESLLHEYGDPALAMMDVDLKKAFPSLE